CNITRSRKDFVFSWHAAGNRDRFPSLGLLQERIGFSGSVGISWFPYLALNGTWAKQPSSELLVKRSRRLASRSNRIAPFSQRSCAAACRTTQCGRNPTSARRTFRKDRRTIIDTPSLMVLSRC